jgi:outer membrane protein assembly factor BamB
MPAARAIAAMLALFVVATPIARADPRTRRGRAPSRAVATWAQFHATADHLGVQSIESRLSPSTASELAMGWKVVTGGPVWSSAAVVGGIVYFGSSDFKVYAVDAKTGAIIWTFTTGGEVRAAPAVVGGVVYVSSFDGTLYALDATTGAELWTFVTSGSLKTHPVVSGKVVYVAMVGGSGGVFGTLWAVSTVTHLALWSTVTYSNTYSWPTVANGIVYLGWENQSMYAYDAGTGATLWTYPTGGKVQTGAAVAGGVAFFGSMDGYLYAVNATTGATVWKSLTAPLSTTAGVKSTPAIENGVVWVDTAETTPMGSSIYAFDQTTGTVMCSHTMADYSASSPAYANGVIYVGSYSHQLYAFDAADCTKLWDSGTTVMTGGVPSSPAVAGGWVYVGSLDGAFVAFTDTAGVPVEAYVSITDAAFDPVDSIQFTLGYAAQWTNAGLLSHTVTDSSSVGYFDSGSLAPGAAWSCQFIAAGIYKYKDSLNPLMIGTVKAPMILTPKTGSATTVFTIEWASATAPAGFVYDVQIKRPGDTVWSNWLTGQTIGQTTFVPDAGTGGYQFRGRLKSSSTGAAINYSAAQTITVS